MICRKNCLKCGRFLKFKNKYYVDNCLILQKEQIDLIYVYNCYSCKLVYFSKDNKGLIKGFDLQHDL